MADNSFLDFNLKTPDTTDYLVGYNADGSTEYKTRVQQILNLASTFTLSGNADLWNAASNLVRTNSASWEESTDITNIATVVQNTSGNWNTAYNIATNYQSISSSFATNTTLDTISSILLPTSIYQNASGNWQSTYLTVSALSAAWEESADILPTVTNYLSTELVTVSSLNVTNQLLSANTDLSNIFLTPANTLTTSICAMSGDGVTPFIMQFTNGLLTSITF